jgi:hypothetical protein
MIGRRALPFDRPPFMRVPVAPLTRAAIRG